MDATAQVEVQQFKVEPGKDHASHDTELHQTIDTHLEALSKAAGIPIDQTQSQPAGAQEISLELLEQSAARPIKTEGGLTEWWKAITKGGPRDDPSQNFAIVRDGRTLKIAQKPDQDK